MQLQQPLNSFSGKSTRGCPDLRNKMPPTCRVPPFQIQPPSARGMLMSLLPQVLTALGPPQPPRIKMVSLSITIWRVQRRVSGWEGFLARPPRADRGRFSLYRRCWVLCPGMRSGAGIGLVLPGPGQSGMQGSSHSLSQTSSSHQGEQSPFPKHQGPNIFPLQRRAGAGSGV